MTCHMGHTKEVIFNKVLAKGMGGGHAPQMPLTPPEEAIQHLLMIEGM